MISPSWFSSVLMSMVTLLVLVTVKGISASEGNGDSCRDTRHGVDFGMVRVPDFQDSVPPNVTCTWSFTAPPGKKLLVKVDSVHFPPQDLRDTTLKLVLDDEVIDIPRNCVRCLKQMVSGHSVEITYSSNLIWGLPNTDSDQSDLNERESENTLLYSDAGTFQIRYKAFDPLTCDKPRDPINGQSLYSSRKLGQVTKYVCKPPYDLFGKTSSTCQTSEQNPVPEWSNGPPKCGISNCSNVPVRRHVLSGHPGAIASPGYPNFKISSMKFNCEWVITADPGYQISSFFSFMELGSSASLSLYDGEERVLLNSAEVLRNLTTRSNVLTVRFVTNNSDSVDALGFYMSYNAVPGSCPDPDVPENGDVIGYSFLVGSTIAFRCQEGFILQGVNQAKCGFDGKWSQETPFCLNLNDTDAILEDKNSTIFQQEDDDETNTTVVATTAAITEDSTILPAISSTLPILDDSTDLTAAMTVTDLPPMVKLTKPSSAKKTKFVSSTKVPLKSTIKPKRKPEVTETTSSSDISTTTTTTTSNDTTLVVKVPRIENGLLDKTKHVNKAIPEDKTYSKASEDYLTDQLEPDNDSDPQDVHRAPPIPSLEDKEVVDDDRRVELTPNSEDVSLLTTYIAVGCGIGLLIILTCVIVTLIVYRKRFPVRMRFGRKFSTFENPMYQANKEQDAQHPRELKRLTV